jgi:hypothetical protein
MPKTAPPAAAVAKDPHWSAKMERLRTRKPIEAYVTVTLDDEAKSKAARADIELASARAQAERDSGKDDEKHPAVVKAKKAADAAKEHLEDCTLKLGFRSLPRDVYEALIADHPPTDAQEAKGEVFNVDTFPAALISACSIDGMPLEDAQELLNSWNQSEAASLFQAAQWVNTMSRLELGKG